MPTAITTIGSTKDVAFFQNADFSRQSPVGANGNILNQDGQIWMGMTTPDAYGSTIAVVNIGSKAVTTITGDTGTTVAGAAKLYGHTGSANAGSTVGFNGASATEMDLVVMDQYYNILIGSHAGNSSIATLGANVAIGYSAGHSLTTGQFNTGLGYSAVTSVTTGSGNSSLGYGALSTTRTDSYNTAIGYQSLPNMAGGSNNTALGANSLGIMNASGGSNNIALGYNAGNSYASSESSNIVIGNTGTVSESNVTRIGTQGSGTGQQNACFIAGIAGVTASNPTVMTVNSSTGQLGNDTTNFTILSTGLQLKGNNTNTAPPAGFIGELITNSATSVSISNNSPKTVTSITLTPGVWDVSGNIFFTGGGGAVTGTESYASISTTNNTGSGNTNTQISTPTVCNNNSGLNIVVNPTRALISSNTTYYMVGFMLFSLGTITANGIISATRVG